MPHWRSRSAFSLVWQIALIALIGFALMQRTPRVTGFSMQPRIEPGELVIINTLAYSMGSPQRGDIVAFAHERSGEANYLKRVIGLPGERVRIERGTVYVNGVALDEPYVVYRDTRSAAEVTVPPDAYYVLGDNRANSDDSRAWGFVPRSSLIGRALFGAWPLEKVGPIR